MAKLFSYPLFVFFVAASTSACGKKGLLLGATASFLTTGSLDSSSISHRTSVMKLPLGAGHVTLTESYFSSSIGHGPAPAFDAGHGLAVGPAPASESGWSVELIAGSDAASWVADACRGPQRIKRRVFLCPELADQLQRSMRPIFFDLNVDLYPMHARFVVTDPGDRRPRAWMHVGKQEIELTFAVPALPGSPTSAGLVRYPDIVEIAAHEYTHALMALAGVDEHLSATQQELLAYAVGAIASMENSPESYVLPFLFSDRPNLDAIEEPAGMAASSSGQTLFWAYLTKHLGSALGLDVSDPQRVAEELNADVVSNGAGAVAGIVLNASDATHRRVLIAASQAIVAKIRSVLDSQGLR